MGRITTDQSHQIMSVLATNIDWGGIDFEGSGLQDLVIRKPKQAGAQFAAFLENGGRVIVKKSVFPVWRTVKIGTHKDAKTLKQTIEKNGHRVSQWSAEIMTKPEFTLADPETIVDLVNISPARLGFTKSTSLRKIYDRAMEFGLSLCPAEVGPQLRLQYRDQREGERLLVAMNAITNSDGCPRIFCVLHDNHGEWLGVGWGGLNGDWDPYDWRFAFVLP